MYHFLINNRQELINRCKTKVGQREKRAATAQQIVHGIPLFLDQLTRTLGAEKLTMRPKACGFQDLRAAIP